MWIFFISEGHVLFKQGDPGNYFYIVRNGCFKLEIENEEEKYFKEGDTFGEMALIQKNRRTGSVVCMEEAKIYCLSGVSFREFSQKINQANLKDRLYFLSVITIFSK
jgi:CRP-like cAMP-binding protein